MSIGVDSDKEGHNVSPDLYIGCLQWSNPGDFFASKERDNVLKVHLSEQVCFLGLIQYFLV